MTKKKTVEFDEGWAKELLDEGLMTPEGVAHLEKLIKDAVETGMMPTPVDDEPDGTVH